MKKRGAVMRGKAGSLRAVRKLAADWRAGWLAGDTDALLSLFVERPVVLPQGGPPIFGKRAIRRIYESVFRAVTIRSTSRLREVEVSGAWGYLWSSYDLTATPKAGGKPIRSRGKSVFILKRNPHGAWKIARLMDNSDEAG